MITVDTGNFGFTFSIVEVIEAPEVVASEKSPGVPAATYLLFYIPGIGQGVAQIKAYFKDLDSTLNAKMHVLSHIAMQHTVVQLNTLPGFVKAQ